MVATTGAGVGAVEGELLGAEAGEPSFLVERFDDGAQRSPGRTRLHVDLDHAGVRGDDQGGQPRVARQRVALDDDRALEFVGHRLDDGQQLDDVLGTFERRKEHPDVAVARPPPRSPSVALRARSTIAAGRAGRVPAGGRSPRCSNGERSNSTGSGDHVSESSGSRRPIGESPGVRYSRSRRRFQVVVPQPVPSGVGCSGMTNPTGSAIGPPRRSIRARSGHRRR